MKLKTLLLLMLLPFLNVNAQQEFNQLSQLFTDEITDVIHYDETNFGLVYKTNIYNGQVVKNKVTDTYVPVVFSKLFPYTEIVGAEITQTYTKDYPDSVRVIFILDDGRCYYYTWDKKTKTRVQANPIFMPLKNLFATQDEVLKQGLGDDYYFLTNKNVYVTRDDFKTLQLDTAGLEGAVPNCLGWDTTQMVYAATSLGLYKQPVTSSVWTEVLSFPVANVNVIYAARNLNLYAYASNKIYVSTNRGGNWTEITTNISGEKIKQFKDDAYGNIYAIVNTGFTTRGDKLYKYNSSTQNWDRIDAGILNFVADKEDKFIFNSLTADSSLLVSTTYGLFYSFDFGQSWKRIDYGTSNNSSVDFVVHPSSKNKIVTSNLGVYVRKPTDTGWTKTYPVNGYMRGAKLFVDKTGTIYTSGYKLNPGDFYNSPRLVIKSTDGGLTWQTDTNGISSVKMYSYFADENGNQYAGGIGLGTAPIQLFVKKSGGNWQPDNNGFTSDNSASMASWGFAGGSVYVSTTSNVAAKLFRRNAATDTWEADTTGLNAIMYDMATEKNGTLLAACYEGLFRKAGTSWSKIPQPPATPQTVTNNCFVVAVDDSARIWALWCMYNASFKSIGTGLFFSTDHGQTWTKKNFDTITLRKLVPIGDTLYGVSYSNGIFKFTAKSQAIGITEINPKIDFVKIYPNPASTILTIEFEKSIHAKQIAIFDLTGRKVSEISLNSQPKTQINISALKTGTYFLKLVGDSEKQMFKFIKD